MGIWDDIRFGIRALRKRPVFTFVAAVSLALGIGLNTAIFTMMNTILLGSLPYRDAERLVMLFSVPPEHLEQLNGVSVPDLFAWREKARSFEAMGAMVNSAVDFGPAENGMPAERIQGEFVTPGALEALGVRPMMGRWFDESEDEVDHPAPVILISHRLWMRRFGGAADILDKKILVNGTSTTILGVMPEDFRFSDETGEYLSPLPINHFQLNGSARYLTVTAKLKQGVTMGQAQAELEALEAQLGAQFPARDMDHGKPWRVRVQPIRQALYGFMNRPLALLEGAVGFVLLIACANVAGLLLARATSRQSEVAIRRALGAGRARIVRQLLTESLVLAALGGISGAALAWAGVRALVGMAPSWMPRLHAIGVNGWVLAFNAAISMVAGLIFGLVPAVQGSRTGPMGALREGVRGGTQGAAKNRLRAALAAGQLALALVLLSGSGLLVRSFLALQREDLGCDPHGVLTFRLRFIGNQYAKPAASYHGLVSQAISPIPADVLTRVFERMQHLPGAVSAAGSVFPPMTGNNPMAFTIQGREAANADDFTADFYPVTPNFFATMKIPMLKGRDFTDRDTANAPWVAAINETMARRFFAGEDPVGKMIRVDLSAEDQYRQVIAVVKDIPASHPQSKQDPAIFIPFVQGAATSTGPYTGLRLQMTYLLRTQGDPMSVLAGARKAVEEIDRNRPLIDARPEEKYLNEQLEYPRYYSMLLGLFAAVATMLAAVGIYGVMAYTVEQRTREIGIRVALGAARWDVLKLIAGQALGVIGVGVGAGLAASAGLARFISSELWEVKASDPATFAGVAVGLAAIAMLACLVPARKAMEVDPTTALRYE
jgi:putative ABC transport system permease protein